ncbi:hypothetical protein DAEQUDRAFT_529481 [Daedalea quercina L-15889]|uniref:Uncharacterized protein n=1 Tax=Daedalea quercina L-15889 TaxID=1314783 RepID=A0A165M814_9APHY|nr:hypothetical protein DAEQUDRAFT_529481 [Daedalea quercina L-15889]
MQFLAPLLSRWHGVFRPLHLLTNPLEALFASRLEPSPSNPCKYPLYTKMSISELKCSGSGCDPDDKYPWVCYITNLVLGVGASLCSITLQVALRLCSKLSIHVLVSCTVSL